MQTPKVVCSSTTMSNNCKKGLKISAPQDEKEGSLVSLDDIEKQMSLVALSIARTVEMRTINVLLVFNGHLLRFL